MLCDSIAVFEHRITLTVAFPLLAKLQLGARTMGEVDDDSPARMSRQTIWFSKASPSCLSQHIPLAMLSRRMRGD
jgi:hypothetical protein